MNTTPSTPPQRLAVTPEALALHNGAITGQYPPNATAEKLAAIQVRGNRTSLHIAAQTGNYPPNTTTAHLKQTVGADPTQPTHTAMQTACAANHLLSDTTAEDLLEQSPNQLKPLAVLIGAGHPLPPYITTQHLLKNQSGFPENSTNLLQLAVDSFRLPSDITIKELQTERMDTDRTLWQALLDTAATDEAPKLKDIPSQPFQNHVPEAIALAQACMAKEPIVSANWLHDVLHANLGLTKDHAQQTIR